MAADGDCHHLCKLMAPVRHRWSINDVIGGIRNTVMPSDCSPNYLSANFDYSTRCRRCDEQETLPHVFGFCHHGELLRINRHNMVISLIASSFRQNASYEVYEEVGCVSSDGSTRPKRDEATGEWRKLHNAELHVLYSSPDVIRNIKSRHLRLAGHVVRMDESRNAYKVLVGRPERKTLLERPRRRWEDNIKMDLREVGCDDRDLINLAQDRDQLWTPSIVVLQFPFSQIATTDREHIASDIVSRTGRLCLRRIVRLQHAASDEYSEKNVRCNMLQPHKNAYIHSHIEGSETKPFCPRQNVRGNNKYIFEARTQGLISRFRSQSGRLIDKPKSGGPGTSNDGNIAH
ncbi:hypothetical protein ANN_17108 [Periplaneta americana]|uniref:Uncharacterized protein n=1 Tax=Periplaneta americana TaxID=6978 RepID=A0ABQ8SS03_PERAM|nr:hypothetical protein ANN_17108 [Periplaneta americana]